MKFNDMKYLRPNLEKYKKDLETTLIALEKARTAHEATEYIDKYYKINDNLQSVTQLAYIRHSINTKDEFYEGEVQFLDQALPEFKQYDNKFEDILLSSPYLGELKKIYGKFLFDSLEVNRKTFKKEIIPLLQEENKLTTEYDKIIAGALIEYKGKTYTLSQMAPLVQNIDRDIRKEANLKVSEFFAKNDEAIGIIYDKLVKLRHQIALELGYENFIQLGYDRMGRTDYGANDVSLYRQQIIEDVLPVVKKIMKRKSNRLGIENLKHYDLSIEFPNGNPTPKGDRKQLVNLAMKMYSEMSFETKEFFEMMIKNELMDLDSKPGKDSGGYCTYIPNYESPFIFANFNGTAHDVDVLTHEAGHAFQVYQSRNLISPYRWPTYEAAEIHSMSMEFLAWPWVDKFFKEDTDKYKYSHLAGGLTFLPYGAAVDHFQHEVYLRPEITWQERKSLWRKIEKMYLPYRNYEEDPFLESGGFYYRQGHIFSVPFYYIDYTLAQVVAFSFWADNQKNRSKTWNKYVNLCKLGGSKSFVKLLKEAKLVNPFKKGTIKKIIKPINKYLDEFDEMKFR